MNFSRQTTTQKVDEIIGKNKSQTYFLILFFGLLYLLFPTANSSMDAITYAADAKWGKDLFQSHHLFYTFFLYAIHFLIPIELLVLGKVINVIFGAASLLVLWKCFSVIDQDIKKQFWLVAFVGSSFAVFRFSTENETYILPIFCSLLGTYSYFKYETENRNILLFLAGFWLSLACLFHQLHFFWWVVFLVFVIIKQKYKFQNVIFFASSAILVPIAYYLVLVFYKNTDFTVSTYFAFVFESFTHGKASVEIKWMGIVRFFVSLFRSFIQLHYTQFILLKKIPIFCIIPIFLQLYFVYKIVCLFKKFKKPIIIKVAYFNLFESLIFVFLAFALVSFGNSEFMVMIPFLIAFCMFFVANLNIKLLSYIVVFQLIWNISLGVIPNHFIKFSAHENWAKKIETQPNAVFYMTNYGEIAGLIYYNNQNFKQNVFFNDCYSTKINSLLNHQIKVYTDCIKTGNVLNTESILFGEKNQLFYKNYTTICVDSCESFSGKEYLYQVLQK